MSLKPIGRSDGRSAIAAAAYRAAECIVEERTGAIHDYTRKRGVVAKRLILPGGSTEARARFWNRLEHHHKRGDAVLARDFSLALPHELPADERQRLAFDYGRELADRYGVAVDVVLHEPDKAGDQRNYHAHVMMSACQVGSDGALGKKANALDPIHCRRHGVENFAERERARWAELHNERMAELGRTALIDHRSLEAQGINRTPSEHLGPAATNYERRTGKASKRRLFLEERAAEEASERLAIIKAAAELERQSAELDKTLLDLSGKLDAAKAERDRQAAARKQMPEGLASTEKWYGTIEASELDQSTLKSLGVEVGPYNHLDGTFPAEVSSTALKGLEPYEVFKLQLTPFDEGLVDRKRLAQASPEALDGYVAYLKYQLGSELGDRWVANAALEEAIRELRLRSLEPLRQQSRADPDDPSPGP